MSDGHQKILPLPSTLNAQQPKIQDTTAHNGNAIKAADSGEKNFPKPKKALKLSKKTDSYVPDEVDLAKIEQMKNKAEPARPELKPQKPNLLDTLQPHRTPIQPNVQAFVAPHMLVPMSNYSPHLMTYGYSPMMQIPQMVMMSQMPHVRTEVNPSQVQPESDELPDMATMMKELANAQYLNINPVVYNQVQPGQSAPYSMGMNSDLKDYISQFQEMTEDEQMAIFEEAFETGIIGNNDSFHGSHGHTYSDIDPNAIDDYYADEDNNQDDPEDPTTWECTPEERKLREEKRKRIFSPDFKDCTCCHGYVFACSSEICKTLGVCHCVAHKQNEENANGHQEANIVPESANCSCCKGHVLSCSCVLQNKKASCHCGKTIFE